MSRLLLCLLLAGADGLLWGSNSGGLRQPQQAAASANSLQKHTNRRLFLQSLAASSSLLVAPKLTRADAAPMWISGKSDPLRPTNIKEKTDGTKKDNKYLSCLNDCVPRKQGAPGPGQKERVDCLDDCQLECCKTYEQCTYTIRK